jgi:uncharacterized protein (DUF1800 family)
VILGVDKAQHLLGRTGFGVLPQELALYSGLDAEVAVDRLLNSVRQQPFVSPPEILLQSQNRPQARGEMGRQDRRDDYRERKGALKEWWCEELLKTPTPLTERMTLFWHNHFTSTLEKCRFPELMFRQNALFRRHGTGDFRQLLHGIIQDPAMMIYLDVLNSEQGNPNENFARELLELFTLGEGHYSEQDVREAARAFTGWVPDYQDRQLVFNPSLHDNGMKQFLGRQGNFDGSDIAEILLSHHRTAEHIVEKLWLEFVSPDPDPMVTQLIAEQFRQEEYNIGAVVRSLLLSAQFYSPENRGVLVKSPVDLLVGTARSFQFEIEPNILGRNLKRIGQNLFDPPSVAGWPTGTAWISSRSLTVRYGLISQTFRMIQMLPSMGDESYWRAVSGIEVQGLGQEIRAVLLPLEPVYPVPTNGAIHALLEHALLDPVYQLK